MCHALVSCDIPAAATALSLFSHPPPAWLAGLKGVLYLLGARGGLVGAEVCLADVVKLVIVAAAAAQEERGGLYE